MGLSTRCVLFTAPKPTSYRPPSPLMDSVREKHSDFEQLGADFNASLCGAELTDVVFLVGEHFFYLASAAVVHCRLSPPSLPQHHQVKTSCLSMLSRLFSAVEIGKKFTDVQQKKKKKKKW